MPTGDVVLVPDLISNSIIISAVPQAIEEIVELIEELDAPPSTVVVRVLMAEIVSEGKAWDDVILDDLSEFVENRPDGDKKAAQPILVGSHDAALKMVMKLAGQKAVKILARSQVATLDNQSAYVQVGGQVPRAKTARGEKPVGIEFEPVGVILGVTPRINPDGMIAMEIDFEKSEPHGGADSLATSIDVIRVQTTVLVADGQTHILGGLVAESGNEKREILTVVTPHIIPGK
jgi:general secretion pathway protein D